MTEHEKAERQWGDHLKKRKVTLIDFSGTWLECDDCGSRWSPNYKPGGKLPRGYWVCPDGCNKDVMKKFS